MKNKILSKAYGGVTEARHRLYGLGLPRQWKVITSTLLLLFTFAIGQMWGEVLWESDLQETISGVEATKLNNSDSWVTNLSLDWAPGFTKAYSVSGSNRGVQLTFNTSLSLHEGDVIRVYGGATNNTARTLSLFINDGSSAVGTASLPNSSLRVIDYAVASDIDLNKIKITSNNGATYIFKVEIFTNRPATGSTTISYEMTYGDDDVQGRTSNNITTISGLSSSISLTGFSTSTSNKKLCYSGQITGITSTEDNSKYADLQFTVADGYTFAPTAAVIKWQGNNSAHKAKAAILDGTTTIISELSSNKSTTFSNLSNAVSISFAADAFTPSKLLTGTIHIRVYFYGNTSQTYLANGLSITGTVASAAPATYTLAWNLDGGSVDVAGTAAGSYTAGTTITAPTVSKSGYAFSGWDPAVPATMPAANSEYTATWTANTHSLTWNIPGDATITNSAAYTHGTVAYGTAIVAPTLSRTGYDFLGWDATPAATMPDNDLEYTATWQPAAAKHNITYAGYGSADMSGYPTQYSEGIGIASFAPLADTEDQHFLGWDPASIATTATTNQTITATWEDKKVVTFNSNGGSAVAAVKVVSGETVAAPTDPTRLNWTFQKWQKEGVDYDFATVVTEDITLDAVWSRNEISGTPTDITLVSTSATIGSTSPLTDVYYGNAVWTYTGNAKISTGGSMFGTPNAKKWVGFTLPSGYTATVTANSTSSNDRYCVLVTESDRAGSEGDATKYLNIHVNESGKQTQTSSQIGAGSYALGSTSGGIDINSVVVHVSEAPIIVTFKTGEATYAAISATSGEKLGNLFLNGELPSGLVVPGYTFNGWADVTKETVITASMTVQANLTPVTYNVTLNKGLYGSTNGAATVGFGDAALTISSAATAPAGYTLLGYFTAADGETKVAEADGSFVDETIAGYIASGKWNKAGDATLYAHWQDNSAVAKIGTTNYATFAEAIAAVAAGQTIQLLADCSYDAAWNLTLAGTVTLDLNGHNLTYNGAGRGVQVHNGAKLVLEDGTATVAPTIDLTADPLSRSAITYTSGTFDSKDGMAAINGGEIEINSGRYLATEGVILVKGNGATATVNDGVLISRDNGVLMGNGTNSADFRNYVINVHGGILLGEIVSTGYASMVIYHPNVGELNIDGGTLVSTNGPAVVCRGGESNITGGTIVAQGSGSGKCGDASLVLPAVGVAYDFKSAYPGVSSFDAKISGDANVSGAAGAVQGIYAGATPTTAEEDAVAISGGTFNSSVDEALCAENYAPMSWTDGTGTHYGVKPLATSIDFEGYYVDGSHGTVAEALAAHNYTLTADMSDSKKVAWDNNSNAYDKGLKIKEDAKTFSFDVAADKLVAFKTGIISGATLSVNGGAAEVLTITDKSDASIKTRYYYSENAQSFVFTTTTASYNIIKSVTIEDPYVVTYDATDGTCATASANYIGTALVLPTPTHATYSFKGWYDAATGGNLIGAAGAGYTPTASITLYAQWEAVSTVNTLSDLKVDGATIDGFDPATNIYYLVYEYGQQPVITSATATSSVATVTTNNTPVDAGTYKYVQVKVVPESGEADQKFYQVRYTNKLKRGVEIIKATVSGGDQSTGFEATGYYGGTGYAKLADNKKMNTNNYVGVKLAAGKTFSTGDVLFVATVSPSTSGGSQIEIYAESAGTNLIWNTGQIDLTNGIALPADFDGLDEFYIVRKASEGSQAWNGFVNYVSVERYMAPFIKEFKIGEAIGTINESAKTIAVEVPYGTNVTALTPEIKAYANGGATLDKTGAQNFTNPVTYKVSSAYAEDGDVTYTVTVTVADHYEAMIVGGASYATLVEAVAAAQANDVVKLLDNVDLMATGLTIAENITLDLNGFNIKAGEQIDNDILVPAGKKLTLVDNSTNADGKIYTEQAYAGSATGYGVIRVAGEFLMQSGNIYTVIESDPANLGQFAVVLGAGGKATIEGGQIKAGWYAISNNGNNTGSTIIVSGGELISTADFAIYNPAKESTVTVTGGVVYGAAGGIAMNRGELNVTGGTITSKDQGTTGTWGDGTGGLSNAAISASGKYESVEVEISGGTIIAEGTAVMITNGTTNPVEVAISGGQFSHVVPEAYCAKDFIPVTTPNAQGKYEVIAAGVIRAAATKDASNIYYYEFDTDVKMYSSDNNGQLSTSNNFGTDEKVSDCGGDEGDYCYTQRHIILQFPVNVKEFTLYGRNGSDRYVESVRVSKDGNVQIKNVGRLLTGDYTEYDRDGQCVSMTAKFDNDNIIAAGEYAYVYLANGSANIYRVLYTEAECTTPTVTLAGKSAYAGTEVTLTAEASALGASYKWYRCDDESGANPQPIAGATDASYTFTKAAGNEYFKVVVGCNCSAETAEAVATVLTRVDVTLQDVTDSITWDFSKSGITAETDIPSEIVLANIPAVNNDENFWSDKIQAGAGKLRAGYYQGNKLLFHTTVPGLLTVEFSNTGSSDRPFRELLINGNPTAAKSKDNTHVTYTVAVKSGDIELTARIYDNDGNPTATASTLNFFLVEFDADLSDNNVTEDAFDGYTRDVTEGRYGTICLPNGGVMVGAELYEVAYYDGTVEKIFLDEVLNGEMVAGRPYIFLTKEGVDKIAVFYTDEANASAGDYHGLFGSYSKIHLAANDNIYILKDNRYYFVDSDNVYCGENRAYFKMGVAGGISGSYVVPAPGRKRMSIGAGAPKLPTGIENTGFESEAPRKVLINGELYIIRGEKMYDAKGQLVK